MALSAESIPVITTAGIGGATIGGLLARWWANTEILTIDELERQKFTVDDFRIKRLHKEINTKYAICVAVGMIGAALGVTCAEYFS